MSVEKDWVHEAMSDDTMVADILLRLSQAPPMMMSVQRRTALQLEWTVRQRRSKHLPRKKGDLTRASPTTPLSWSGGGTSVSGGGGGGGGGGGADGFEESSQPSKTIDNARSKAVATSETTTNKRSRKKKTLTELKEEESLLLKERRNLKNQLATWRLNFEKERATNERLKRIKLDVISHQTVQTVRASQEDILNQPNQMEVAYDQSRLIVPSNGACNELDHSLLNPSSSSRVQESGSKGSLFVLPDLNLPVDDDLGSRILYGIS